MPGSCKLFIAILFCASITSAGYSQSLLSNQETTRLSDWLDSPEANLPENIVPRAMLQLYLRSALSLNFVASDDVVPEDRPMALATRAVQCAQDDSIDYCLYGGAASGWMEADADNLAPYLLLMKQRLASDDDSALRFLQEGLEASRVESYYFARFMVLREVLQDMGILPGRRNFIAELITVPSLQEIYGSLIAVCTARVTTSTEWTQACLQLADKLETGETFYANVMGAALRRDIVPLVSSDEDEIAAALDRRARYVQIRQEARAELDWWMNPEGRPNSWYEDALEVGELEALRRAIARARD